MTATVAANRLWIMMTNDSRILEHRANAKDGVKVAWHQMAPHTSIFLMHMLHIVLSLDGGLYTNHQPGSGGQEHSS